MNKALKVLQELKESAEYCVCMPGDVSERIDEAIKELLAQPEQQEPVAWMYDHHIEVGYDKYTEFNIVETCARNLESENCINIRPLYTAPPKREPMTEKDLEVLEKYKFDKLWGLLPEDEVQGRIECI